MHNLKMLGAIAPKPEEWRPQLHQSENVISFLPHIPIQKIPGMPVKLTCKPSILSTAMIDVCTTHLSLNAKI
jgi:hypothetical protein